MGMIVREAALWARARRKLEEARRAYWMRKEGELRSEPLATGYRDPSGKRTDAPAEGWKR